MRTLRSLGIQGGKKVVKGPIAGMRWASPFGMGKGCGNEIGHDIGILEERHRLAARAFQHLTQTAHFGHGGDVGGEETCPRVHLVMCI